MASQGGFLIDKSAAARLFRAQPFEEWGGILEQGRIGVCAPTEFEILYSARSHAEYTETKETLRDLYGWYPVPDDGWRRLLELHEKLAAGGQHRAAGMADLLVAVTAMHHRLTLLHYDHDFETIARHSDLETRWLAEPGSLD
ncbi:PIN domain nuclease [Actinacidiphila soli]|jgi:predicted nucleic acid-binding protein|uniref:PIN domain nuclease n=1 Tax=Actinacidiphila soli TaxID=2487275 RepID=UPI000FCC4F02|nr:PIN domain nuclease [Actinacidiphila soli]MDX6316108.1 hypothetical protein [Streptomyces sp.]